MLTIKATTPVWRVAALATLVAAVTTELFGLAARALDVPMKAGNFAADHAEDIFVGAFAFSTILYGAIGTIVAVVLARKVQHPAQTWVILAGLGTLVSLIFPLTTTDDTTTATQVMLVVSHLIAAAVIIPPVAKRLSLVPATRASSAGTAAGPEVATS
jgi:Family of unknown function (DUF6069)